MRATLIEVELKPAAATVRSLIVATVDWMAGQCAEKQRAHSTMSDKKHVTLVVLR